MKRVFTVSIFDTVYFCMDIFILRCAEYFVEHTRAFRYLLKQENIDTINFIYDQRILFFNIDKHELS